MTASMLIAVKFCGGGVIPLFPSGTVAVAKGLYRLILSVVPPFRGIIFKSAGIFISITFMTNYLLLIWFLFIININ